MELGLSRKVALVLGASRGIGLEVGRCLASEGACVIGVSRSEGTNGQTISSESGKVSPLAIDLLSPGGAVKLHETLVSAKLLPDIIVHCYGGTLGHGSAMTDISGWRDVMHCNFELPIEINNLFLPDMLSRGWGRVVHISSAAAYASDAATPYAVAKRSLDAYVKRLAGEIADRNVVASSVVPCAVSYPGNKWSEMERTAPSEAQEYLERRVGAKRFATPHDVARVVTFLASECASFCHGSIVNVDGYSY